MVHASLPDDRSSTVNPMLALSLARIRTGVCRSSSALAAIALLTACEVIQNEPAAKQDTATATAAPGTSGTTDTTGAAGDSLTGVPAVASDSALAVARAADTGA